MKKKVIIIGAGPAGLTAAYELLKETEKYEVIILEKDGQVGGIAKTVTYLGNRMDLGGHRFFTKRKEINELWQEILPIEQKRNRGQKNVLLIRNRLSHIYYHKKFFDYPVSLSMKTIRNLGIGTTFVAGMSYIKSKILPKKETNLENFYINRFGKKLYEMFFKGYTEKLWGRSPNLIAADWGSQRVKGLSIMKVISSALKKTFHIKEKNTETSLIEKFYYPKYGPGQMWECMKKQIIRSGGTILSDATVTKIHRQGKKVKSITALQNGKEILLTGDIFISSMPLKDLIAGMNDVPKNIQRIANGLPYRDFLTIGLLVKKVHFESQPKIKDTWIYVQEPKIQMGRIQVFNNWSPYLVKNPKTYFLGLEYFCTENDSFWNKKDRELKNFAVRELCDMGIIKEDDVLGYHVERVPKAYPAYFDTYSEIDQLQTFLNTIPNLYEIGRNGQHRYNNMDHSMLTAIEAVRHIEHPDQLTKEDIWKVNTEKEYMEEQHEEDKRVV